VGHASLSRRSRSFRGTLHLAQGPAQTQRTIVTPYSGRRATVGDEAIVRALRLEALSDAPWAFSSSYERGLARTTADWQRWFSPAVTFILELPDAKTHRRRSIWQGSPGNRPPDGDVGSPGATELRGR
jgi:hypothetical protein